MTEAIQKAFDEIDAGTTPENWLPAATAKGLLIGYDARYRDSFETVEIESIEMELEAPLHNIDSKNGSKSRTFNIAGKLDKVGVMNSKRTLFDHKTTSEGIDDPDAPYWRMMEIARQPMQYEILLLHDGIEIDQVVWDVVRKPGIKPKGIVKKDLEALNEFGTYFGATISDVTIESFEGVEKPRENGELYTARLAAACIEDPNRYFQRRQIVSTRNQLGEHARDQWDIGQEIIQARRNDRHLKNESACMNWGSPCKFLGLCSGYDSIDSGKWKKKDRVHAELEIIGDDGRGLLTNSRMQSFLTCRQKHFYEYELAVERVDAVEKEVLFFGSLWHAALDVYWAVITGFNLKGTNDVNSSVEA